MKNLIFSGAVLAAFFAQPAAAREWPDLQNWFFFEDSDFCEMATTYGEKDEVKFSIVMMTNGKAMIGASGTQWSFENDKPYDIRYAIDEDTVGEAKVRGWVDGDYKGFITEAEPVFIDDMMKSGFFLFSADAANAKDNMDVSGSDQAYAQLKACVAELKKKGGIAQ
ncbi:hypothetical protein IC614_04855 [Allosphingosinicella flava]|uniref:Uncharacterized protein n=1 Tax=Allosphingosinicella flava TaxID=2771430 RepID=A0A7T2LMT6_9SPHN|nr:hypothetical protein [Sphingosinicella flava]QPQ55914.1 hypothetical protein IC614_04855 [Sphingosinicella flava]